MHQSTLAFTMADLWGFTIKLQTYKQLVKYSNRTVTSKVSNLKTCIEALVHMYAI